MRFVYNFGFVFLVSILSTPILLAGNFVSSSDVGSEGELSRVIQARLQAAAIKGLSASWSESRPGYSSRWVRQVLQKSLPPFSWQDGNKYFGSTSANTMQIWQNEKLLRTPKEIARLGGVNSGDILFFEGIKGGLQSNGYGLSGIVTKVSGKFYINGNLATGTDARTSYPLSQVEGLHGVGRL